MNKQSSVFSYFDFEVNVWSPRFRRNLHDWEIEEFCSLLNVLGGVRHLLDMRDCLVWRPFKKGIFSIKSCYDMLFPCLETAFFPFRKIWNLGIPFEVSFFLWNVYMDKILSLDNLQSRE